MPHKTFTSGSVLTAADVNTYLMEQAVMTFATETARNTALPTPVEGMLAYLEDKDKVTFYTGSAWEYLNPYRENTEYFLGGGNKTFTPGYGFDVRWDTTAAPISDASNCTDARLHFPYEQADVLSTLVSANHACLLIQNADGVTASGDAVLILRDASSRDHVILADDSAGALAFGIDNTEILSLSTTSCFFSADVDLDENVDLNAGGGAFAVNGTNGALTSAAHTPVTDNLYDLGSATLRWDDVYATNTTIQSSDLKVKKNVQPLDRGLTFIQKLKPIEYQRRDDKHKAQRYWGFAYQDIKKTLRSNKYGLTAEPPRGGTGGIRPVELLAPTIKAVQELADQVKALEARVAALEKA